MSNRLLLDNWLLSDVEDLLEQGPAGDRVPKLILGPDESTSWSQVPHAPLQVEGLLRLLVSVVTRDELILEEKFRATWGGGQSPLSVLHGRGMVGFQHISTGSPEVRPLRDRALDAICTTEPLRIQQEENERSWALHGKVAHHVHSLAIWGGAGYLARSHVLAAPYSGHPIREDVLKKTAFRAVVPDATGVVLQWVDGQQDRVFQAIANDGSALSVGARLPSIAVEIVEASRSVGDLLPVALQLRDEYADFRNWMADYQAAAEAEDPNRLLKHRSVLRSVESNVARRLGADEEGSTSISFSLVWLNVDIPMPSAEAVRQKFGMRALLNRMIFTRRGTQSLKKLVRMFGEDRSARGQEILAHFGA